jgi:hypothetical protein
MHGELPHYELLKQVLCSSAIYWIIGHVTQMATDEAGTCGIHGRAMHAGVGDACIQGWADAGTIGRCRTCAQCAAPSYKTYFHELQMENSAFLACETTGVATGCRWAESASETEQTCGSLPQDPTVSCPRTQPFPSSATNYGTRNDAVHQTKTPHPHALAHRNKPSQTPI